MSFNPIIINVLYYALLKHFFTMDKRKINRKKDSIDFKLLVDIGKRMVAVQGKVFDKQDLEDLKKIYCQKQGILFPPEENEWNNAICWLIEKELIKRGRHDLKRKKKVPQTDAQA
ncbi:hypothetical protein CFPG_694 [Candidatus Azobacteroides pseudotrichonymphae genomovar. CFP2]|uniref:Uncharacterized protein n=2 Tax=Candidatus Azobacteroides TaxID=511434 RepID=B6YQK1_AZOPC|nr:hypothetical protein CFPG_210 [Candidatus Azobacteroides pseudotrichonymphae genomovar. CFP2]BAG83957.1 hypothetical protein CFPG_694 [Candidatus Azobacteroides pseudotrichonymphae genomovar. CFP2]